MIKTCFGCSQKFEGQRNALTCSARCRKRFQRLMQKASAMVKKVEEEVKNDISVVEQSIETTAQQIYSQQGGFINLGSQGVAVGPSTNIPLTPVASAQPVVTPPRVDLARQPAPEVAAVQPAPEPVSEQKVNDLNTSPVVQTPTVISAVPGITDLSKPEASLEPVTDTTVQAADADVQKPVSWYSTGQNAYPLEDLEVHEQDNFTHLGQTTQVQ